MKIQLLWLILLLFSITTYCQDEFEIDDWQFEVETELDYEMENPDLYQGKIRNPNYEKYSFNNGRVIEIEKEITLEEYNQQFKKNRFKNSDIQYDKNFNKVETELKREGNRYYVIKRKKN